MAAAVILGIAPGSAAALLASPLQRFEASGLGLSQTPAGLRAAVRRTLGAPATPAANAIQEAKFAASDGASGDELGVSVAVSGSASAIAVVGAPAKNSSAGAAYVFVRSGTVWSQQAELTASDGSAGDQFGYSVAISGSTVVVGAPDKNSNTGAAYVFVRSGTRWSQQAELTASDGGSGDTFGFSVALSGSTAVIGAPATTSQPGAAYVFAPSGAAWSQQAKLTASDGVNGDFFGVSVAISKSTALVGAYGKTTNTGAAYVFVHSTSGWFQQAKLAASDAATNDYFGWSVAISGATAVVGAFNKYAGAGAAYVFAHSTSGWLQRAELTAADGAAEDNFGLSVGISGSTVVVGAPYQNSSTGATYLFVGSGTAWSQQNELRGSDSAGGDVFGAAVAISSATIVAGAPGNSGTGAGYVFELPSQQAELTASDGVSNDEDGWSVAISGSTAVVGTFAHNSDTGAAYVFVHTSTGWAQQAELTASDGVSPDSFGASVAIYQSTIVVGAPNHNGGPGAAYVFTRSGTTWSQQAELLDPGSAGDDQFGYSVAISGSTAVVGAVSPFEIGSAYVFVHTGSGWVQQAKLTALDGATNDVFGNSVAIYGSTVVVGAPYKNSLTGAVYVFVHTSNGWVQQAELTASDAAPERDFGWSVAIAGSTAVIGEYDNSSPSSIVGAAYVFSRSGTVWSQQAELTPSDGALGDGFGEAVAISGSVAIVGAPGNSGTTGAVYVFDGAGTPWSQQAKLTASDAGSDNFGWSVAISGSTAAVGAPTKNSRTGAGYVFANL